MMIDRSHNTPQEQELAEAKPFCDGVRAQVQGLVASGRLRMTNVVSCLHEHGCNDLAADILASLSWQSLPPAERNGAYYRSMRLTGLRICDQDPSKLIISAHEQHRSVDGKVVAEFPDTRRDFTFSNMKKSKQTGGTSPTC